MDDPIKITLPKLGESIVSATVVQWFKKVGDPVALDEPLLEVSTDKVNSEIPSPAAGILQEILVPAEQELQVGETLALLATKEIIQVQKCTPSSPSLSPCVLRQLQEKGISLSQIDKIPHTGENGRLTKKDVEKFTIAAPVLDSTERVKMTPMRKAIADNMVRSFYEAPHATLINEVDVTRPLKWIQENKEAFFSKTGAKLTITAIVAQAIAKAVQKFPHINSSLEDDTIVVKKFVNIGIAVSVDNGVMVPVIKNCQDKTLGEIAHAIGTLAEKTRNHSLAPDDIREGSITLTNFGMTGTMIGVPIIRYPEVAIIGLGAITKKVAALPDDSIAIRSVMMVSLTFDHRVLDGIYGCHFLNEVKREIENFSL